MSCEIEASDKSVKKPSWRKSVFEGGVVSFQSPGDFGTVIRCTGGV